MSQVPRLQVVTWSHVHIYLITYTCRTCNMHQTQFLLSDNSNLSEQYHVLHLRRRYKDSWRSFDWFSYFDWGQCKHMAKYISSHTTDHTDESEPAVWLYLVVSRESPLPPYVTYVYLLLRCSTPLYVYTSAPYGLNIDILQHTHVHSTDYSNWYGVSVDLISHTCILPTSSTISTLSRYSLSGHFHHNETHFSRGRRRDKVALGILNSFIFLGHLRPDTFHVPNNFQ